jgi:hypothetical protein
VVINCTYAAEENLDTIGAAAVGSHLTQLAAADDEMVTGARRRSASARPTSPNE